MRGMSLLLLSVLLLKANTHSLQVGGEEGCYGECGVFDFYVLRQEWPATFCMNNTHPLCLEPTDFMRLNLTLHGLWPSYDSAGDHDGHAWPQCCKSPWGSNLTQAVVDQWLPELLQLWPDANSPTIPYNFSAFWTREVWKHGTCSGLDPSDYLGAALHLMETFPTPPAFSQHAGHTVLLEDLYSAFNASVCQQENGKDDFCWVAIGCNQKGQVDGVTSCWSRQAFTQTPCPPIIFQNAAVACTQQSVALPAFPPS